MTTLTSYPYPAAAGRQAVSQPGWDYLAVNHEKTWNEELARRQSGRRLDAAFENAMSIALEADGGGR